jgi:hypothetical protein
VLALLTLWRDMPEWPALVRARLVHLAPGRASSLADQIRGLQDQEADLRAKIGVLREQAGAWALPQVLAPETITRLEATMMTRDGGPGERRPPKQALPSGHRLVTGLKTTADLLPGDCVHVPALARYPVAATPVAVPGGQMVVKLAWDRLAILAPREATWEAVSVTPPVWAFRACSHCGGTGRA